MSGGRETADRREAGTPTARGSACRNEPSSRSTGASQPAMCTTQSKLVCDVQGRCSGDTALTC